MNGAVRAAELRARAALGRIQGGQRTRSLVHAASEDARLLVQHGFPSAIPMGALVQSRLALLDGNDEAARRLAARAADGFALADMPLYRAVAQRRLGEIVGGDEGMRLRAEADAEMVRRGVRWPERVTTFLAP
jgi:hypothetical protein